MVTETGGVVNDPELKFLNSGAAAVKFSIAVDNGYMKNGEWQKKVSFFDIVAYNKLAENAANTLKKGTRTCVTGKLEQRSWDTPDGKRYVVEIVADDISVSLKFVTADIHRGESGSTAPTRAGAPRHDYDEEPF